MDMIEYNLCKNDIFYFMEKYLNLELRSECINIISKYSSYNYVESAGGRGSGQTTINLVYALWRILFIPDSTITVICNDMNQSIFYGRQLLDLHRVSLKNSITGIPSMIRQSTTNFGFDNGSKISFISTKNDTTRGFKVDIVILENIKSTNYDFYSNALFNIVPRCNLTIVSDSY